MRKNRFIGQDRCYHLISRLAHRAFFLDDEEKDRAVALMRRVEEFSGAPTGSDLIATVDCHSRGSL